MAVAISTPTRLVSVRQGAVRINVTPKTMYRLLAAGRLTGYRIGGTRTIRLDMDEVEALARPMNTGGTEG